MTLPENFAEGLNLAGTGMALVFVALVVFMLILMTLNKLFPGEELELEPHAPEPAAETSSERQVAEAAPVPAPVVEIAEPPAPQPAGRIPGAQIAAMAVSIYLAMEREEQAYQPVEAVAPEPALVSASVTAPAPESTSSPSAFDASQPRSGWGAQGRAAFRESQGRRAPSYNHRPQSPFNPRGRDNR